MAKCYGAQTANSEPDCDGPDVQRVRVFRHPEAGHVPFVTDWCSECRTEASNQGAELEVLDARKLEHLDEAAIYAIDRKFSTRPRCCDWCDRRGFLDRPLVRLYIKSDRLKAGSPEPYYWWVHQACGAMILEDETISEYLWL